MLEELIEMYETGLVRGDLTMMHEAEKQLRKVGMDRKSLLVIVNERKKSGESAVFKNAL